MADAGLTFLLEKLAGVVLYYGGLIAGAKHELQELEKELKGLKSCLTDMAHRSGKGEVFKNIERETREVIYEVEDTLDICFAQAATAAAKKKKNPLRKMVPGGFSLAEKVKSLRKDKVKPMYERANKVLADSDKGEGSGLGRQESRPMLKKDQIIRQDKVVGFKDEEEKLTKYLMEPTSKLDVISIIGMPGLGKTTLAWKIYESQDIQYAFRVRIWVNVSQKLNMKDLCLNILRKFTSENMSGLSDQELYTTVRRCLETEKFLIVLDDVWKVTDWDDIKNVFPMTNGLGKVMITSREMDVGVHASTGRDPHPLRFLTPDESWELLQLEVFKEVNQCPTELKAIGKQIAHNCDGLPLTIVVIGGILVAQNTRSRPIGVIKTEWLKVSENVTLFLKTEKSQRITQVVALSYERLPDELRECLVYMGVFPEDHVIPAWTLTRLWIAEGFVHPTEGQSLEETAEENLNDLISRNLLMLGETNAMGEVKTCRVHDVIRTFCFSKAAEQNLFQEVKLSSDGVIQPPVSETEKYHRLCFHSDLSKFLSGKPKGPSVRSFLCFYKDPVNLAPEYISAIPDAFNLLRVLDSNSVRFHLFPPKVTKLIHLRYVTLCVDNLTSLPEPISELWNLQTLVVDTKSHILTVKVNLWRMIMLRHFKTKAAIVLDQSWEGAAGENLQTLGRLSPECCTEIVAKRACNIKKLGIRGKIATLFNAKFLENLHRLEKLKLVNEIYYESTTSDQLHQLPPLNGFPQNLKRLTLMKTSLPWSQMSTLAKIATLEVLKLKDNAFTGPNWEALGDGFHGLQFLLIAGAELLDWQASTDHFPSLTCLTLRNCGQLLEIPKELATKLQKLDIDGLRASAIQSAIDIQKQKEPDHEQKGVRSGGVFQLSIGPKRV